MKFRSSIFSSESLQLASIPRDWWLSTWLLFAILVTTELGARFLLAPIGDHLWAYDSAALSRSYEWYRARAVAGQTPTILAVGDSTGARNFSPRAFQSTAGNEPVYSLARAGNFPRALRSNTLPLLEVGTAPEIVILFQWPGSLRDDPRVDQIEAGAVSSILEARQSGRFMVTDYLYVTRLFRARDYLVSYWLRGEELLRPATRDGFHPLIRPAEFELRPVVLPDEPILFAETRRDVVRDLVNIAARRGFVVVAIVGPFRAGNDYPAGNAHLQWLQELRSSNCTNMAVLDLRTAFDIPADQYQGNHHLYEDGAKSYSAQLGPRITDILEQKRNGTLSCD